VRAAIGATPSLATIRVCGGTYVETGTGGAVRITRNLRLIGAGDGSQPGETTIVRPARENLAVVVISTPVSPATVSLERLQFTGAFGNGAFGLLMNNALVTLDTCTVTDNHVTDTSGGGMEIIGDGSRAALINTHVTGNSSTFGGGGIAIQHGQLTLDARSRVTGNTTTGNPGGGIYAAQPVASVDLQGLANVSDNDPNDCGGTGTFTGPGAVCTGT